MKWIVLGFALILLLGCTAHEEQKTVIEDIEDFKAKAILSGKDQTGECVVPVVNLFDEYGKFSGKRIYLPENCEMEVKVLKRGWYKAKYFYLIEAETESGTIRGWVSESLLKSFFVS